MRSLESLRPLNVPWSSVAGGILIGAILVFAGVLAWQPWSQISKTDFEGTIVERWADYSETEQGSRPRLRLLVESDDRERFTLRVEPSVYEVARIGMRIKSRAGKIELMNAAQESAGEK
jgi:hypothetical protein